MPSAPASIISLALVRLSPPMPTIGIEIILLISSTANTKISAGGSLYGVLFVTDKEYANAEFTGNGTATVYGSVIMDAVMEHFNGTFQIVYVEELVEQALETGLVGAVAGGWTDFHAAWQ